MPPLQLANLPFYESDVPTQLFLTSVSRLLFPPRSCFFPPPAKDPAPLSESFPLDVRIQHFFFCSLSVLMFLLVLPAFVEEPLLLFFVSDFPFVFQLHFLRVPCSFVAQKVFPGPSLLLLPSRFFFFLGHLSLPSAVLFLRSDWAFGCCSRCTARLFSSSPPLRFPEVFSTYFLFLGRAGN